MLLGLLLCTLLTIPGGGDRELFRARTERTDPKDPRALLELGSWCEERGHPGWAMICYRKVLQLAESPERPEASFRLARIEIGKERTERGYARLRAIATRYNHAGARALLEEAENELTRRQKEHLAHAGERLSKDDPKGALRAFTAAYELLPADPEGAPFVPAGEILRAIARCRDLLDDEHFNVKIRPVERSIRDCLRCKQYGGFERCIRCNGNGKVKKVIRVGRRRKVIWVTCGRCDGYKWLICKTCGGLETTTDKLSSKETEVLRRLIGKARGLKTLKKPLKSALQDVEGLILNLDDAPSLSYLRTVKAGYSVSRPLRSAIRTVPPSRDSLSIARKVWKNAVSDPRVRSNFLSSYACEFARHLAPFEMLRNQPPFRFKEPPTAAAPPQERLTPDLLAAFPEEASRKWIAVEGLLSSYADGAEDPMKGHLQIAGELAHHVHFFIWLPPARQELEWLGKTSWRRRVGDLPRTYPFDIREKLKKAPKDHQVLVVGRFLRDRLGHPRNWFEVWDVRIGLHRSQEEIVRRLRDPIEIRFPSAEAAEVAAFLRWYGVELSIGGIDDRSRIGIEAVDCPLGLLIDELARALGASWYLDGARVVLCPEEQNRRRSEMAAVIDRLHAINEGTVSASLAAAPLPEEEKGAAAPLSPGATDPLKLREEAVAAMAGMRYGEALTLYERLLAIPGYAEEWPELLGTSFRARLFDAMTATTPVSRLGEAGDLTRLTIRNREGEVFEQTVEVVGRDDSYLWVQPSYGGEIRVPGGWVRREDPILAREWRQRKREELSVLEQRLEEPGSRESLHARYMLALFCKTYRFEGRGNDCLEDAIGDDEFEWLIGTYFPKRHHELLGYWRRATGRASPDEQLAGGEILFGDDEEEEEEQEEAAAAPPRREVAKAPRRPRPAPGASSAEIEKLFEAAQKEIEAGRRCLSRSLPGMKDASKQRRDALRHFQAAEKHVRKLIRKGESNEDTRELLNRITVLVQTCLKDLGFFD